MLGKIIDGRLVVAGRIVKEGNTTITNPTEEKLKELGYKEIQYDLKPEYDKEEENIVEMHKDCGTYIEVWYGKEQLTDEEHNAVIQQEIVAEENKITPRNIRNAIKGDTFALDKITEVESNIYQLRQKLRPVEEEE